MCYAENPATVPRSVSIAAPQQCICGFTLDLYRAKFRHVFPTGKTKAAAGASPSVSSDASSRRNWWGLLGRPHHRCSLPFQTRGRSNRTSVSAGGRLDEVKASLCEWGAVNSGLNVQRLLSRKVLRNQQQNAPVYLELHMGDD